MSEFYNKLINGSGSRDVTLDTFNAVTEVKNGKPSCVISSIYKFKGETQVTKITNDLIHRVSKTIKLTKIEIIRLTNVKNVNITIKFVNDDGVMLYSENDNNLVSMSDHELLKKLGVYVQ